MIILLNGIPHPLDAPINLAALIDSLALPAQAMAVAVNRRVIRRDDWAQCVLHDNDCVDIVKAIGGG